MKTTRLSTVVTVILCLAGTAIAGWTTVGNTIYTMNDNVGIGMTSPVFKLDVRGSVRVSLPPSGTYADFGINDATGSSAFHIGPDGEVGIGTTNPAARLHVVSSVGGICADTTAPEGVAVLGHALYGLRRDEEETRNYGGHFVAEAEKGIGVYGSAPGGYSRDIIMGVMSTDTAAEGEILAQAGQLRTGSYGGYFEALYGTGVYGTGLNAGIEGDSAWIGVWGSASYDGGPTENYGGYFEAKGGKGRGVYGRASKTGACNNYGGYFVADGDSGRGVYALATGGSGVGVYAHGGKYDFFAQGPGTNYGSSSSIRWKRDIRPIEGALDRVMSLRGVYFNWDSAHGGAHDMGMIAEEVGRVLPEIVGYEENGIDATGMDYGKLTPLLVEAVKSLQSQLAEQSLEIKKLKDEVSGLRLRQREDGELRDRLAKWETVVTNMN